MVYGFGEWLRDAVIVFGAGIILRGIIIAELIPAAVGLAIFAILVGYLGFNLWLIIKGKIKSIEKN